MYATGVQDAWQYMQLVAQVQSYYGLTEAQAMCIVRDHAPGAGVQDVRRQFMQLQALVRERALGAGVQDVRQYMQLMAQAQSYFGVTHAEAMCIVRERVPGAGPAVVVQRFVDACNDGCMEEVQRFVAEHGAPTREWCTATAYEAVAKYGHLHILQWAVAELGVDLKDSYFPRHMNLCRHLHVLQWLVENGVCMDRVVRRWCMLEACGRADGLQTVQWLCAQGADPRGEALDCAVRRCRWDIALWLVQRVPDYVGWPRHVLVRVMARCWSRARDAWMRSVTDVGHASP